MTFKSCWRSLIHGKWTAGRLMSRKWWVFMAVTGIAVAVVYSFTAWGVSSSPIVEKALDVIQNVAIAYFSVNLIEKAVDAYKGGNSPGGDV